MPLIRCSEQKRLTLEEFYKELIPQKSEEFPDVGTPMLNVISLINNTFQETIIYGLTSHDTLLLLSTNDSMTPWFVALKGLIISREHQHSEYYIEYLMTSEKQPWPDAKIVGATRSLHELKNYLILAMTESDGWPNSDELKLLYDEIKLKK